MEEEVADYLINYYSHLIPGKGRMALKHVLHGEKLAAIADEAMRLKTRELMLKAGWLSTDEDVLCLLREGTSAFRSRIAQQIYNEHGGRALLNNCPLCKRLTRTPSARQCRHCGHDWH